MANKNKKTRDRIGNCWFTGKRVFRKRRDAKVEAARAFNRGFTEEKMTTYQCPYCRNYHMTSHPHPRVTPIQEADTLDVMAS